MPNRGRRVAAWMNSIVRSVAQTVADLTGGPATGRKTRAALLEWIDPIMGSGHWYASSSAVDRAQPVQALLLFWVIVHSIWCSMFRTA